MEAVIFMLLAIAAVAVVGMLVGDNRRRRQEWANTAERLVLDWDGDAMHGMISEIAVRVSIELRTVAEDDQRSFTVLSATLDAPVPRGLSITREGLRDKMTRLVVGETDIQLALPGLDEKLLVHAADEAEVRRWAQRADVSRALVELANLDRAGFRIEPDLLEIEIGGMIVDGERVEALLEKLVDVARALSDRGYGALFDNSNWRDPS